MFGIGMGLHAETGTEYLYNFLFLYIFPFGASYFIFKSFFVKFNLLERVQSNIFVFKLKESLSNKSGIVGFVLVFFVAIVTLAYYPFFGFYPGIRAVFEFDYFELYLLRKSVTSEVPTYFNYITSFTIKAVVPFTLLFLYIKKHKFLFLVLVVLAFFIGINNMQKSFFLLFYLPVILYSLFHFQIKKSILLFLLTFSGIYSLVVITNPSVKYSFYTSLNESIGIGSAAAKERMTNTIKKAASRADVLEEHSVKESNDRVLNGLLQRTVYLPGRMAGKWFKVVPSVKPFLGISGYGFLARLFGVEHHEYAIELYPLIFKKYHKQGYTGSVNVASFMNNYVCFGWKGVLVGSVFLGCFFSLLTVVSAVDKGLLIATHTMPILFLSSTSLSILLFSGGWGLFMLLVFMLLVKPSLNSKN